MQKTKWWAIALVICCTLFTSTAQVMLKLGVMKVSDIYSLINLQLFIGILLYVVASIMLLVALKFGELSVLYPALATSFIWVSIFSIFFLEEVIPFVRWFGVGFIMLGISLIGFGSKTIVEMRRSYQW